MKFAPRKFSIRLYLVVGAAVVLSLMAGLLYWVPAYIEASLNRQDFNALFAEATGGTFSSGRLRFHVWPMPHVVVPEGRLSIPERLSGRWQNAKIYPAYIALMTGNLRAGRIVLEKPDFTAHAGPGGAAHPSTSPMPTINSDALKQHLQENLTRATHVIGETRIEIRDGRLKVTDLVEPSFLLHAFDLDLQGSGEKLVVDFRCRSNFWDDMRLTGSLQPASTQGQLQIALQQFDPELLFSQLPLKSLRWQKSPLNIQVKANLEEGFHAKATVKAQIPSLQLEGANGDVRAKGLHVETTLDYSPRGIHIDNAELRAREPLLHLAGRADFNRETPLYQIEVMGHELLVDPLREAALALAGDNEVVAGIFDVLRGGRIPWIRFSTRGATAQDMALFDNMTIAGLIQQGRLFIPGADLDLTDVNGKADIAKGVLEGRDLAAAFGGSSGSDGRLWLDFGQEQALPFYLEIDVEADLAPLPSLLEEWVEDRAFRGEMRRIQNVTGTATGTLLLDGRGTGLDVTVDATRCRLDADYDRLPAKLSIKEGMVQYTRDRIQVVGLQGQIDTSQFDALTAHVTFGDRPIFKIDRGAVHIDLAMITPWLDRYEAFEALPFKLQSNGGWIKLERLALEGPLFHPSRWQVETRGAVKGATIVSPPLPGPVQIATGRFTVRPKSLVIPEARLTTTDAELDFQDVRVQHENWTLAAAVATVSGTVGETSGNWIADQLDLGQPWRLKPPVALSGAELTWSADGAKAFRGAMTTGGGTQLTLDLSVQGDRLRRQSVVVEDQDSHAALELAFEPESLEVNFEGRFASATIARMMQEEYQHSGYMEGQFSAHFYPGHPGRSSASGTLQAHDIHQPLTIPQQHQIKQLFLEARDNRVLLQPAVVIVEGQTHRLSGSLDIENDGFLLDLVHEATQITLSPPEKPAREAPPLDEDAYSLWDFPLKGRIISRIDALTLGPFQWSPVKATTRLDKNGWHCRIEDASLCGIATLGDIHFGPQTLSITLNPAAQEADFDETMTCLLRKPNLIEGRFDLNGHLKSQNSYQDVVRAADGQMTLKARSGRIYRFNLLSKVLAVVNLTEIFRGKMPDLMENGLAYDSIAIQVDVVDGLCIIKEAVIDGASANLAGQGAIDLVTGQTDMVVLVAPFKTVDALVRYTPVIGDWLGGTLISIPVKVTGAFDNPTVTPLAPSAVGSSLMNLMKKTIKLPIQMVTPFLKKEDAPSP